ncbi:MAG: hypothetical protein ACLFPR_00265 [Desulfococcaceae bacterium]
MHRQRPLPGPAKDIQGIKLLSQGEQDGKREDQVPQGPGVHHQQFAEGIHGKDVSEGKPAKEKENLPGAGCGTNNGVFDKTNRFSEKLGYSLQHGMARWTFPPNPTIKEIMYEFSNNYTDHQKSLFSRPAADRICKIRRRPK